MRFLSVRRLLARAGVIAAALAAGSAWFASPAPAQTAAHDGAATASGGVSARPANGTPALALTNRKATQTVRQLVKCGNLIFAVGDFKTITQAGHTHTRNNIFSFSATAPFTLSKMVVDVNGPVNSVAFTAHRGCADAYIGGSFTSVHGTAAKNIAEINTSTGAVVKSFGRDANDTVNTLVGYKDHLLAGGQFTCINGYCRSEFASLSPSTGRDDGFLRLKVGGRLPGNDTPEIYNQQLSHSGGEDLVEGNFTSVGGASRNRQAFIVDLTQSPAKLTSWNAPELGDACRPSESFYARAGAWSPSDGTVYFATTGFHLLNWQHNFPLNGPCDAVLAFPAVRTTVHRDWAEYSGCDSYYAVAATTSTVFAAGHERWADNPGGCNAAGPGAVTDPGMGGFAAGDGHVEQSGGQGTYQMAKANGDDMMFTSAGLWIASSNRFRSDTCGGVPGHSGICLLPRT